MPGEIDKLKEIILYVAAKMEEDRHAGVGRIKLAKLLWRIDFTAYWKLGHTLSGATYQADRLGPAPVEEPLATRDLEAEGRFEWESDWDQRLLPVARDAARLDGLAPEEVALVDHVVDRYRNTSGKQMVDEAHLFPGWIHAWRDGEGQGTPIPPESIFWERRTEVTRAEDEHASVLAADFAHLR